MCARCGAPALPSLNYCVHCGARLAEFQPYPSGLGPEEYVNRLAREVDVLKSALQTAVQNYEELRRSTSELWSRIGGLERDRASLLNLLKQIEDRRYEASQRILTEASSPVAVPPQPPYAQPSHPPTGPTFPEQEYRRYEPPEGAKLRFPSVIGRALGLLSGLGAVAGLIATLVMTAVMGVLFAIGVMKIPLLELLGALFGATGSVALAAGITIHLLIGVAWALIYTIVFGSPTLVKGILFSLVQTAAAAPFFLFLLLPRVDGGPPTMGMDPMLGMMVTVSMLWLLHFAYSLALIYGLRRFR